jgi:dihydrofolate reductase
MPAWPPAAWRRKSSGCEPSPGEGNIAIGGATLAAEAAALGLIDEYGPGSTRCWFGGGIPFFPQRERRVDLELVETLTFSSRVVYLRYPRGALMRWLKTTLRPNRL